MQEKCPICGSEKIDRKADSKWLFSIRDEHELNQYKNLDRIVLLLMDYPKFDIQDYKDIRITTFEIYPKDNRMSVFNELISNHYYNIFLPKLNANEHTNPMNLHPFSFQFYKCNPIKTFECIIENIDTNPIIYINKDSYIKPEVNRDNSVNTIPMPSSLLKDNEWEELLSNADFESEISPLFNTLTLQKMRLSKLTESQFAQLSKASKSIILPELDERLRNYISLRDIVSTRQKTHYQRGR